MALWNTGIPTAILPWNWGQLRCENRAGNGPFGGCIVFQQYRPPKKTSDKPKRPPKQKKPSKPQIPDDYVDETEPVQVVTLPDDYQYKKRAAEEDAPMDEAMQLRFKRD
ncbi:hypothetical protein H072_4296 [Dactylellina haptotyla CBS 200.50]|uniref:Uncharacterized protein n=1 Tax=Dactylellina haptotyla (strain CBS 200.50) TaxID=1284197 RepID=S8AFY5_DACHA|nr:hypothetical protein H072_4296 [Dactylellina haptotyla CBS 200.50]